MNRKGVVWSIKACKPNGCAPDLANCVLVKDAIFKISLKVQARVRAEGKKYVHAFVCGRIIGRAATKINWLRATYDPYKYDGFVILPNKKFGIHTATRIESAKYVKLDKDGMWIGLIGVTRRI